MKLKFTLVIADMDGEIDLEDFDPEEISHIDFTNQESVRNFIIDQVESDGFISVGIEPSEVDIAEIKSIKCNDKAL